MAEPLFSLAGEALSRVCRLCRKSENRRKSTKSCSDDALRMRCTKKTRFSPSLKRLGVDFGRLGTLPGAPGRPVWPLEGPESRQARPRTPERAAWSARERAEATKIDAKSRPAAEKSNFLRAARSRSIVEAIFRRFLLIFAFSVKSVNP